MSFVVATGPRSTSAVNIAERAPGVGRELKSLTWNGRYYAKIDQKATVNLCNHKSETITVEITFRFGGKADDVSNDGEVTLSPYNASDWQNYRGDPVVNNSSEVHWRVTLEPGEVFAPTVKYHFYTRH